MNTIELKTKIKKVFFRDEKIFLSLEDGREIGAPLEWYPKLYRASEEELLDYTLSPGGYGVHWNKVDEDLSAYGMLYHDQNKNSTSL